MYICLCNAITDKQIRRAAKTGVKDIRGLQRELGVAVSCGSCSEHAMSIVRDAHYDREAGRAEPAVYVPSPA